MSAEINGDIRLSIAQRLEYLVRNFFRNFPHGNGRLRQQPFCATRLQRTPVMASPSRALTEAFLYMRLPEMLPLGNVRVLEIGCGSGSLTRILADIGYPESTSAWTSMTALTAQCNPNSKRSLCILMLTGLSRKESLIW